MTGKVRPGKQDSFVWPIALVAIIVLAAHLAAARSYSNWTWGFNHYYFLTPSLVALVLGLGAVLCLPPVWGALAAASARKSGPRSQSPGGEPRRAGPPQPRLPVLARDLAIAGAAAMIFWLLRMPYHFLGDGRLMIRLLDQGKWFHATSPLDRLLHYAVLLVTRPLAGWDATLVHAAVSVGAGFVYVLAALRLGRLLRHSLFVVTALLGLGTVQLFLGYAESYSPATAAILVYLVLALEHLSGHRRLAWVGLALLTGVALHIALLFLVPSFIYLMLVKRDKDIGYGARQMLPGIGFLGAVLVLAVALLLRGTGGSTFLPIWNRGGAQYALLSWQHLVDLLNEQVLVSPLAWVGMIAFICAFCIDTALRNSRRFRFLLAASAFPMLFSVVIKPGLGGSRDWDLWSMGSLAYVVTVIVWLVQGMSKHREAKFAAYLLVVVGLFHTAPWVGANHSWRLSLERFHRMLDANPLWTDERLASATSELAHFYIEAGAGREGAVLLERAVKLDPGTSRYWDALGVTYIGLGRFNDAEAPLRRALDLDPDDSSAHNNLGRALEGMGRLSEAEISLKQAIALDPQSGTPHFNLGRIYLARGDTTAAIGAYTRAVEFMPYAPDYWYSLARILEAVGGHDEQALEAWKQVVANSRGGSSDADMVRAARSRIERLRESPGRHR